MKIMSKNRNSFQTHHISLENLKNFKFTNYEKIIEETILVVNIFIITQVSNDID